MFSTPAEHLLAAGGSRSGKTFGFCYAVALRACKYPESRHVILRHRFNHVKQSVVMDTMPKVLKIGMPQVPAMLDRTDWLHRFPNGSEVWYGGLDDKERVEKILGKEFGTIYFNECSQLSYDATTTALTRLAQKVDGMRNLALYDCNPPSKAHWTYKLWKQGIDPVTMMPIDPADYAFVHMNPMHNADNIDPAYLRRLMKLPPRQRMRFLDGLWQEDIEGALWQQDWIDKNRVQEMPKNLVKIAIGLDPSVTDGEDTDEVGIIGAGVDDRGRGYVFDDSSGKMSTASWGLKAVELFHRHGANTIVAEVNQGGDLVESNMRTADKRISVTKVRATHGKMIRAEPVSALYEHGEVSHVGIFPELEEQLVTYTGKGKSPGRMDALVWVLTHLMLKEVPSEPGIRSLA